MDTIDRNPYSPPASTNERSFDIGNYLARWSFLLLVIGAIAYHAFVLLLFLSPPDRHVAFWFLANTPVVIAWLFQWHRDRSHGAIFGLIGSVVQVVIAVAMLLALEHADPDAVIGICGTIVAAFLALAWGCHYHSRSAVPLDAMNDTANSLRRVDFD